MPRKTYNLSQDAIEYLKQQDNMSAYLTRLVRQDMKPDWLERKVQEIIRKIKLERKDLP
jgi:hypothetical protein